MKKKLLGLLVVAGAASLILIFGRKPKDPDRSQIIARMKLLGIK